MCGGIGCKVKITRPLAFHDSVGDLASRFAWSEFTEQEITTGDLEKLKRAVLGQVNRGHVGLIPVVMTPLIKTVGLEIGNYVDKLRAETGIPVYCIRTAGDATTLMQGYLDVMMSVARILDWSTSSSVRHRVNIWGYPFDRYEGDHTGNIEAMRDLLKKIGITVNAVFFSGVPFNDLYKAGNAMLNIVLPPVHAKSVELQEISGLPSVCVNFPIGISGTTSFLHVIASAVYRNERLEEQVITQAYGAIGQRVARKEKKDTRKVLAIVDPWWASGIEVLLKECGFRKSIVAVRSGTSEVSHVVSRTYVLLKTAQEVVDLVHKTKPDIILASDREFNIISNIRIPKKIRFGFPMYQKHFQDRLSIFGYSGVKNFIKSLQ